MAVATQARLHELLHYEPGTGVFTWIVDRRCGEFLSVVTARKGSVAGGIRPDGYRSISIDHKRHQEHVLAWIYVHGAAPANGYEIDHINGVRHDNRILNLRLATRSENQQNLRSAKSNNRSSGVLGVHWDSQRKKWRASATLRGKRTDFGFYPSIELAAAARTTGVANLFTHAPERNEEVRNPKSL